MSIAGKRGRCKKCNRICGMWLGQFVCTDCLRNTKKQRKPFYPAMEKKEAPEA